MTKKFTILDRLTSEYIKSNEELLQNFDWNIHKNKNRYLRLLLGLALKFSNQWNK